MSNQLYPEEFKIEAVTQMIERDLPMAKVAARLAMSNHSMCEWEKGYSKPLQRADEDYQYAELRRFRAVLRRVTEERDILKKPPRTLLSSAAEVRLHQSTIRRLFGSPLHASCYYAWRPEP